MTGGVITQIVVFHGDFAAVPAVFAVLVGFIAWGRRDRTVQLYDLLRRTGR